MPVLELESLTINVGNLIVCEDLSLTVNGGRMLGILGRNGVGKTTFLHALMAFRPIAAGKVRVCGTESRHFSRRHFARHVGLLFQESESSMPATVRETVMLGRHPYSENLLWDSHRDVAVTEEILMLIGLESLADRQVSTLSGGEKQRLAIALLLAQNPKLYLLDEPSNHLDIEYQIKILSLLEERIRLQNAALLMASHDINLVARFCDQVLLLMGGGKVMHGPAEAVLTPENLESAFNCPIAMAEINGRQHFLPA